MNITNRLFNMAMDSRHDREVGSVGEIGIWYGLFIGEKYGFVLRVDDQGSRDHEAYKLSDWDMDDIWTGICYGSLA